MVPISVLCAHWPIPVFQESRTRMAGAPDAGLPAALLGRTISALKRLCGDRACSTDATLTGSVLTAHMVAFPITTSGKASAAGEVRGTSSLLVPRKGATPAWQAEFADLLANHGLTAVASEKEPPELEAIQRQATSFSLATVTRVFYVIQREWRDEASRLYFLVPSFGHLST